MILFVWTDKSISQSLKCSQRGGHQHARFCTLKALWGPVSPTHSFHSCSWSWVWVSLILSAWYSGWHLDVSLPPVCCHWQGRALLSVHPAPVYRDVYSVHLEGVGCHTMPKEGVSLATAFRVKSDDNLLYQVGIAAKRHWYIPYFYWERVTKFVIAFRRWDSWPGRTWYIQVLCKVGNSEMYMK